MGSVQSDLSYNIRAQAQALGDGPPIYKLIGVSGGGELLKLIRVASKTKKYDELDSFIKKNVSKFLLNDGKGENIPIEKLVYNRALNKEKFRKSVPKYAPNLCKVAETKRFFNTREICSNLDDRGSLGESLIHLCLLNGSRLHNLLAKRLIFHYPKMVNDIYTGDEFYGESALHIAIINEDAFMVNFLIRNGANLHQRCCGRFFSPEDQKSNRRDVLLIECPVLNIETNYNGYFYYGEYPLSFAAVLNQFECARLLVANGADINRQDSNGNTVMHMCVIRNNMEMFRVLMDFNPDLTIKNRLGYSAFTLSAKLARKEIFEFISQITRKVYWVYADISCAAYALKDVDTIGDDGETDPESALFLIANGESEEHLEMIDGFLVDLLNTKWINYIRIRFYLDLALFFVFYALCSAFLFLKYNYFTFLVENYSDLTATSTESHSSTNSSSHSNDTSSVSVHKRAAAAAAAAYTYTTHEYITSLSNNSSKYLTDAPANLKCIEKIGTYRKLTTACKCAYLYSSDPGKSIRTIIEIIIVAFTVFFIAFKSNEIFIRKLPLFLELLKNNTTKLLFFIALICILLIVPMRFLCIVEAEDMLIVISIILLSTHILYFAKGFKLLGTFVYIFMKIVKKDLSRFFLIYIVFIVGFSQAFYLVFDSYKTSSTETASATNSSSSSEAATAHSSSGAASVSLAAHSESEEAIFNSPLQSIMDSFVMSLSDILAIYSRMLLVPYATVGKILLMIFLIIVSVLLVNILIAMMANTYDTGNEDKREWIRQWAKMVLLIEQNLSNKERLKQQNKYAQILDNKEKALIVRWKQNSDERTDFKKEGETFARNIRRNLKKDQ